jgi:hypothetical protein
MKYTKTYDNFITNLLRKKLPTEVIQLGEALTKIVKYYINIEEKDWVVEMKKIDTKIVLYIEPYRRAGEAKIIELYNIKKFNI